MTGFQGVCAAGDITSLGRGGSDTTAVALAAALESDCCGIYPPTSTDILPTRLIPDAVKLSAMDYRDMLALAGAGSQVLHAKSVELAMAKLGCDTSALVVYRRARLAGARTARRQSPDFAGITRSRARRNKPAGKAADAAALSRAVLLLAAEGIECSPAASATGE